MWEKQGKDKTNLQEAPERCKASPRAYHYNRHCGISRQFEV